MENAIQRKFQAEMSVRRPGGDGAVFLRGCSMAQFDFGPETVGGFAAFEVVSFKAAPDGALPVMRLSYACHPEGLSPVGDFPREESAYYLHVDNPVLPANPGRFEIYTIPRTGTFVAPLLQGQLRYVRAAQETPGASVEIAGLRIVNAGVHSEAPAAGAFECAAPKLEAIWHLGVRSCQLASFPNPDGWRVVEGALLPRRLERGAADGWCRFVPDFAGTLELDVEFRRNPHFGGPAFFEVFTGWLDAEPAVRETIRQKGPDGAIRTVRVPMKPGRFGFLLEKEQWPVVHEVRVLDESGVVRWKDDFGKCSQIPTVHKSSLPTNVNCQLSLVDNATAPRPGSAPNWVYPTAPPYLADGAKRDRLVWSGDLWWSQRTAYCAFGPADPCVAGALRILAAHQTPEGFVQAAPYAEDDTTPRSGDYGLFASDEFSAWFVPVLWQHLLYTGDEALARALWPAADRDLRYLATRMGPDGLHAPRLETSKHAYAMDCGDISKRMYQNLVFWMAWRDGAHLARALGLDARAAELEALASDHAAAIRRAFSAPAETPGFWNTILGETGADPLSCSMLLASGFLSDADALALVRSRPGGDWGVGKFRILAMRGMLRHGLVADAMRLLAEGNWSALADPAWPGAHCTTECLYLYTHGWWDESHPDTSVSDLFQNFLLGVEPVEPGFRVFRIAPQPPDGLAWARGRVPTPHGLIEVEWRRECGQADCRSAGGLASNSTPRGRAVRAPATHSISVPSGTTALLPDGRAFGPGKHNTIFDCNREPSVAIDKTKGTTP
ncbi:MAG: hypothetical protein IKH04_09705 [Kiritimatiellae bacterium]|nr:hypothetical protein [Kiritimatiellia bacterium]